MPSAGIPWVAAHLHCRQPTALGSSGCHRNVFWPAIRQRLLSGRMGKSRELKVFWIVRVCVWATRVQREVGIICKS